MSTLIIWVLVLRFPSTYETFPAAFETEAICRDIGRAAAKDNPSHPRFECMQTILLMKAP